MKVANLYGMIQPGSQTAAVRAVFFVDPRACWAMIYYPLALGRNFDEIKRVLVGLQAIDAFGVAMPADWRRPGDEVIVPMKGEDMNSQRPEGVKCYDWFFCTRRAERDPRQAGYEIKDNRKGLLQTFLLIFRPVFSRRNCLVIPEPSSRLLYRRNCLIVGTVHLSVVSCRTVPLSCLAVGIFPPPENKSGLSLRKTDLSSGSSRL